VGAALGAARLARLALGGGQPSEEVCLAPPVDRVVSTRRRVVFTPGHTPSHLRAAVPGSQEQHLWSMRNEFVLKTVEPVTLCRSRYEKTSFSYRVYDKDRVVLGKRMEEWLKVARLLLAFLSTGRVPISLGAERCRVPGSACPSHRPWRIPSSRRHSTFSRGSGFLISPSMMSMRCNRRHARRARQQPEEKSRSVSRRKWRLPV